MFVGIARIWIDCPHVGADSNLIVWTLIAKCRGAEQWLSGLWGMMRWQNKVLRVSGDVNEGPTHVPYSFQLLLTQNAINSKVGERLDFACKVIFVVRDAH